MIDPLAVLDVQEPCTEPWDGMKGDGRKRHCERCHQSVYNLSVMTREEAWAVLRGANTPCVRFLRRADGTVLTRDCAPLRGPRQSVPAEAIPPSGIPPVDLSVIRSDPPALLYLQRDIAERYGVLPLRMDDGALVLAVSRPPTLTELDDLRFLTIVRLELALAGEQELREAIRREYDEHTGDAVMGEPLLDD